tara:strand:- start:70 stop:213 length:144 start_codon:yes stop_codon:yes gene_type:complete
MRRGEKKRGMMDRSVGRRKDRKMRRVRNGMKEMRGAEWKQWLKTERS